MIGINNTLLQKELDEKGFATVQLLTPAELEAIRNFYHTEVEPVATSGFYSMSHNPSSIEFNLGLSRKIKEITQAAFDRQFSNYRFFVGHFSIKKANHNVDIKLHQDWNLVDEAKYTSYQIWIPLEESGPQNGGMYFLPYSHKFYNNYRSGNFGIPQVTQDDKLRKILAPVSLKAGEAVIFSNGTFHGSNPNTSSSDREAVLINICPADAASSYYYKDEKMGRTRTFDLTPELFLTHLSDLENGIINPLFKETDSMPLPTTDNSAITATELVRLYNEKTNKHRNPIMRFLAKSFQ